MVCKAPAVLATIVIEWENIQLAEADRCSTMLAELMRQIAAIIKAKEWKQADAAIHCGVTQPRINDLLRGRVSRFSIDALVNIATALGQKVNVELQAA